MAAFKASHIEFVSRKHLRFNMNILKVTLLLPTN